MLHPIGVSVKLSLLDKLISRCSAIALLRKKRVKSCQGLVLDSFPVINFGITIALNNTECCTLFKYH